MLVRFGHAAACALCALPLALASGCAMPVMHPMRVHDGPGGRVGAVVHVGGEKSAGCDNFKGCTPQGAGGLSLVNLDGRWGHVFGEHYGLMGGVYFPGFRNSKSSSGYSALVGYGFATVQGDVLSVGAGPEVGSHVYGGTGGVDLELTPLSDSLDLPRHLFSLSGYYRVLRPYTVDDTGFNPRVPSWDMGAGVRVGPVVLQYSYYRQSSGVIDYTIYETSIQAQSWHMVTLAGEFNRDTLDFSTPSDRARAQELRRHPPPPRPPPRPSRLAFPGCEAFCKAQAALSCGIDREQCSGPCRDREIAPDCWDEDDAVLLCQAAGVQCQYGRAWFPACREQQSALDRCERLSLEKP